MTTTTTPTTERACQRPGCSEKVDSPHPMARYCSPRCRRAAHRDRARPAHPAPDHQTVTRTRRTRVTVDPSEVAAEVEAFRAALERETLVSLARDPERWRHARAADPDEHRRRARRQPWRATS